MVIITEIAQKLEKILNGLDAEVSTELLPSDLYFKVETEGYHLDHISVKEKGKNFIPVFIGYAGGDFEPVPNLKKGNFNVNVVMYYPVRFKDTFYALNEYLVHAFVGKLLNYGNYSGVCLSNISPCITGELQDLDMREFKNWADSLYCEDIDIRDKWQSMSFSLFLTTLSNEFTFGNQITYNLKFTLDKKTYWFYDGATPQEEEEHSDTAIRCPYKDTTIGLAPIAITNYYFYLVEKGIFVYTQVNPEATPTPAFSWSVYNENNVVIGRLNGVAQIRVNLSEDLVWTNGGTGLNVSPISQQLIDGTKQYATNIQNITNYSKSIIAYVRNTTFWKFFLLMYNSQDFSGIYNGTIELTKTYTKFGISHTFKQVLLTANENIAFGDLLTFTLAFGD